MYETVKSIQNSNGQQSALRKRFDIISTFCSEFTVDRS